MMPEEVLDYWFADADDEAEICPGHPAYTRWFHGGQQVDEEVTARFAEVVQRARRGLLDGWRSTPEGGLALVIVLDQFPRHIFRGQRAAFDSDGHALSIVTEAIEAHLDAQLALVERIFLYLPIQHSEVLADHDLALERFISTAEEADLRGSKIKNFCRAAVTAEREHIDTLRLFGRYPYRNNALGRRSTLEELSWLERRADGSGERHESH